MKEEFSVSWILFLISYFVMGAAMFGKFPDSAKEFPHKYKIHLINPHRWLIN